jgi:hypothetical protein
MGCVRTRTAVLFCSHGGDTLSHLEAEEFIEVNELESLRLERDELSPSQLSPYELKERTSRRGCYEAWKAATETPTSAATPARACARQKLLLSEWTQHSEYGIGPDDLEHQSQAWKARDRLISHAAHCGQCAVFPLAVPLSQETSDVAEIS